MGSAKYHDRYRTELLDLLQKKAKGKPLPEPKEEWKDGEVVDLMEALRQSVAATREEDETEGQAQGTREAQSFVGEPQRVRKKRDPKSTPEPFGSTSAARRDLRRAASDASRLPLRLPPGEKRRARFLGSARSVPLEPGAKALAVHVEDHPLEYAKFEVVRSLKGQYGGGTRRDLRQRHVRAARGEGDRAAHVRSARQEAEGRWSLLPAHMAARSRTGC